MAEKIWNDLLKRWKECPKFLKQSETNKRSRSVAAKIGVPPYAGGSIPVSAHKELLRKELKREPTPKETFVKCYTKKDGTCTGKKAEDIVVAYDNLVDQATELVAMTEESPPVNLNRLWIDATRGVKNGLSVFGMGSDARAMIEMTEYSSSYRAPFCQDNGENMQEDMRGSIQEVREEITQHNQWWENMFEQLIQRQKNIS